MARKKGLPYRLSQTALKINSKLSVLKTSDDLGWHDINASLVAGEPYSDFVLRAIPDLWLAMFHGSAELTVATGGSKRDLILPDGSTAIIAPDTALSVCRRNESVVLHAFVRREVLAEVTAELSERDLKRLEIVSSFGVEDRGLAFLLHSLERLLFEPAGYADVTAEYLARALASRVLRKSANLAIQTNPATNFSLTDRQIRLLERYIRDHLPSKIALKELAALLNLGETNFVRRFKASFWQTPHQYIMRARVNRARELLERSALPIIEIAALCGFADQTHLGVVFKQFVGVTPLQYRRSRH